MVAIISIMVGIVCAVGGYLLALSASKRNARSEAAQIKAEAERQGDIIQEKARLKAQEDALKITSEAERVAAQKTRSCRAPRLAHASASSSSTSSRARSSAVATSSRPSASTSRTSSRSWTDAARSSTALCARPRTSSSTSPA